MGKKSRRPKHRNRKEASSAPPVAPEAKAPPPPPLPPSAACWICLDEGPDDDGRPLVRDCCCRGDGAGFAHLSCLVKYATMKTGEIIDKGKHNVDLNVIGYDDFIAPWQNCPNCNGEYQRRVALDMAKSLCSFVDDRFPGDEVRKLGAYQMIIASVLNDGHGRDPELREEGRKASNKLISAIQRGDGDECINPLKMLEDGEENIKALQLMAYSALGTFAKKEGTKEGYELAEHYRGKVMQYCKAYEKGTNVPEPAITELLELEVGNLQGTREGYASRVKKHGKESPMALRHGITLVKCLLCSGAHGVERERLCTELAASSQRALGPDHPTSKEINIVLEASRRREVWLLTRRGPIRHYALRHAEAGGKCVVRGPINHPRRPEEERTTTYATKNLVMAPGTPVVCTGLKGAAHLNGKIGDVRNINHETGRYPVHFEEAGMKPALIKQENLRILFNLPDKTTDASDD